MSLVLLLFANDDLDVVGPLMEALRREDWDCRPADSVVDLAQNETAGRAALASAMCVLAVWSSNSADARRLRAAAEFARSRGNLVQARLDDVALPFADDVAIDLTLWPQFRHQRPPTELTDALRAAAGLPPNDQPPPPPRADPRKGLRPKDRAVITLGLLLSVSALAMAAAAPHLDFLGLRDKLQPRSADDLASVGTEPATSAPATTDALMEWASVPRTDVAALRRFAAEHPGTSLAAEARSTISQLDDAAWSHAQTQANARDALTALEAYRETFPNGRNANEASLAELAHRDRITVAQRFLAVAGYQPGPADGVIRQETVTAIEQFERTIGQSPTGQINDALLASLASEWPAVADWIERDTTDLRPLSAPLRAEDAPVIATPQTDPGPAPASPPAPAPPFRDCYVCPEMVPVPPGRFQMGDQTGEGDPGERPVRWVDLANHLAISRFEITFDEWDACVAEGGCRPVEDDRGWGRGARPVLNVARSDAEAYANWLQRRTNQPYRLLSEAEWEYAARAGSSASAGGASARCRLVNAADANTDSSTSAAVCTNGFIGQTAPAGSFEPNAFGLHDMFGNVAEWTADCWAASHDGAAADGSPRRDGCETSDGVVRGGSWETHPQDMRPSHRGRARNEPSPSIGFRIVRVIGG